MRGLRFRARQRRRCGSRSTVATVPDAAAATTGHVLAQVQGARRRAAHSISQCDAATVARVARISRGVAAIAARTARAIRRDRYRAARRGTTRNLCRRRYDAAVTGLAALGETTGTAGGRFGKRQSTCTAAADCVDEFGIGAVAAVGAIQTRTAGTAGRGRRHGHRAIAGIGATRRGLCHTAISARLPDSARITATTAGGDRIRFDVVSRSCVRAVRRRRGRSRTTVAARSDTAVHVATAATRGIVACIDIGGTC